MAPANPAPKFGITLSTDDPSQAPLPFMSKYHVPLEKTPTLSPAPVLPGQLPTTGIALGNPAPKFGITLSTDDPSQAPLPFMSKYHVPLEKTPILSPAPVLPGQLPTTGIALGNPAPKFGITLSTDDPSQAPLP